MFQPEIIYFTNKWIYVFPQIWWNSISRQGIVFKILGFQGQQQKTCFQSHSNQIVVLFGLRMVLCTYLEYQQLFATPSISKQLPGQRCNSWVNPIKMCRLPPQCGVHINTKANVRVQWLVNGQWLCRDQTAQHVLGKIQLTFLAWKLFSNAHVSNINIKDFRKS